MKSPLGYYLKLNFSSWGRGMSLGPGWAALAGALSVGYGSLEREMLLQLIGLWLVVDPLLGTLWDLIITQGLGRSLPTNGFIPPAKKGFSIPYARPGSLAGQWVIHLRRSQAQGQLNEKPLTFSLVLLLTLLLAFALKPTIFWLTMISLLLMFLNGEPDLTASSGGRFQSLIQFLLPWAMGAILWGGLTPLALLLAICYWVLYLGALRMLGEHHRAEWLFFGGQIAAIFLLLAWRLLPGAAILTVLLLAQKMIQSRLDHSADFLSKIQPYLIFSILVASFSLGNL